MKSQTLKSLENILVSMSVPWKIEKMEKCTLKSNKVFLKASFSSYYNLTSWNSMSLCTCASYHDAQAAIFSTWYHQVQIFAWKNQITARTLQQAGTMIFADIVVFIPRWAYYYLVRTITSVKVLWSAKYTRRSHVYFVCFEFPSTFTDQYKLAQLSVLLNHFSTFRKN